MLKYYSSRANPYYLIPPRECRVFPSLYSGGLTTLEVWPCMSSGIFPSETQHISFQYLEYHYHNIIKI